MNNASYRFPPHNMRQVRAEYRFIDSNVYALPFCLRFPRIKRVRSPPLRRCPEFALPRCSTLMQNCRSSCSSPPLSAFRSTRGMQCVRCRVSVTFSPERAAGTGSASARLHALSCSCCDTSTRHGCGSRTKKEMQSGC